MWPNRQTTGYKQKQKTKTKTNRAHFKIRLPPAARQSNFWSNSLNSQPLFGSFLRFTPESRCLNSTLISHTDCHCKTVRKTVRKTICSAPLHGFSSRAITCYYREILATNSEACGSRYVKIWASYRKNKQAERIWRGVPGTMHQARSMPPLHSIKMAVDTRSEVSTW